MKQKFICGESSYEIVVRQGETLLDLAKRGKIPIHHSCGGMGTCGTCRIVVRQGLHGMAVSNEIERELIQDRGFKPEERLACQNYPSEGLVVEVPSEEVK